MNRRGFFSGLLAVLGLGGLGHAEEPARYYVGNGEWVGGSNVCEHKFEYTPYVLVYGEVMVQRGPELRVCKRCGELRVDVQQHRNAMLQREYDSSLDATKKRVMNTGFWEHISG